MHFSTATALFALSASVASAAPLGRETHHWMVRGNSSTTNTTFPLANGFPNPDDQAKVQIQLAAGGTLSDAKAPPPPSSDGITNLKFIAFNELFEVAYFTALLKNVTTYQHGFLIDEKKYGVNHKFVVDALTAIVAQEELHVLNANGALHAFHLDPIVPCGDYEFPVSTFDEAIALAGTFTDVVLGTLQDVQQIFASINATGLVRGIGSVIGQEGEQEGFFRILQKKRPSSAAFLTTSTRDFAFSALNQNFVKDCSTDASQQIPLSIFGALNVDNAKFLENKNGTAKFSVDTTQGSIDSSSNVVYISGQNLPVVVPITDFSVMDGTAYFEADFPFEGGEDLQGRFNQGLTIAAVVPSGNDETNLPSADAVAKVATFGPGLIEID